MQKSQEGLGWIRQTPQGTDITDILLSFQGTWSSPHIHHSNVQFLSFLDFTENSKYCCSRKSQAVAVTDEWTLFWALGKFSPGRCFSQAVLYLRFTSE